MYMYIEAVLLGFLIVILAIFRKLLTFGLLNGFRTNEILLSLNGLYFQFGFGKTALILCILRWMPLIHFLISYQFKSSTVIEVAKDFSVSPIYLFLFN